MSQKARIKGFCSRNVEETANAHVVLWGAANVATLALDALPAVRLHGGHHHWCELQTCWVACSKETSKTNISDAWFSTVCLQYPKLPPHPTQTQVIHTGGDLTAPYLSVHSLSRTPAPPIGQSFGLRWSLPDRSRSNRWAAPARWAPS